MQSVKNASHFFPLWRKKKCISRVKVSPTIPDFQIRNLKFINFSVKGSIGNADIAFRHTKSIQLQHKSINF
jgi:hypothetical protein